MINKVILVGNLGKDPDVKHFDGGSSVASFSVATSESYKDKTTGERKEITEWVNVVCWGGLAGVAEKYLKKGSQVYIEGKLTTRSWETTEGQKRYTTEVIARTLKMLGSRGESGRMPTASDAPPMATNTAAAMDNITNENKSARTVPDDDLPF